MTEDHPSPPPAPRKDASAETWTIRKVLGWTTQHFEKKDLEAPRLTAELLIAHSLKLQRVQLYLDLDRPLSKQELSDIRALIERRMEGEPTQYLTGYRHFYNRRFSVDSRVLVPRPETELLVEAALRPLAKDAPSRVLDLCTGSGCVGVSIAAERPLASVLAVDLSADACAVARQNAQALEVDGRVTVREGDLFAVVPEGSRFDVVVGNPPYIASAEIETLSAEVRREPRLALDGGQDGLAVVARIIQEAPRWLKPGGLLALEIGDTQGPAVLELLQAAGYAAPRIEKDLARLDRLALGTRTAAP